MPEIPPLSENPITPIENTLLKQSLPPSPHTSDVSKNITISALPLTPELEKHNPTEISITHHLPDFPTEYPWLSLEENGGFANKLQELKDMGFTAQRFDARWNNVQPTKENAMDTGYLKRCAIIVKLGDSKGLNSSIVLSSVPKWALETVNINPDTFFQSYTTYVDAVCTEIKENGVKNPTSFQIFNELNMRNYTPPELLPHIEKCINIVREQSRKHWGRDIPLVATIQISSPAETDVPGMKAGPLSFIKEYRSLLEKFDEVKLDYYPGIWHQPPETSLLKPKNIGYYLRSFFNRNIPEKIQSMKPPTNDFSRAFSNTDLLKDSINLLQPLKDRGVKIGIGEIGVPSVVPFETQALNHDQFQKFGVGVVLWGLAPIVRDQHLSEVGMYQLFDEPKPETGVFNWGIYKKDGTPKAIVEKLPRLLSFVKNPADWRK